MSTRVPTTVHRGHLFLDAGQLRVVPARRPPAGDYLHVLSSLNLAEIIRIVINIQWFIVRIYHQTESVVIFNELFPKIKMLSLGTLFPWPSDDIISLLLKGSIKKSLVISANGLQYIVTKHIINKRELIWSCRKSSASSVSSALNNRRMSTGGATEVIGTLM